MFGRYLLLAAGLLGGAGFNVGRAQAPVPGRLDSLRRALSHTTDTARVMTLWRLGHAYYTQSQWDSSLVGLKSAQATADRLRWTYGQAMVASLQGSVLAYQNDYRQAQAQLFKALNLWQKLGLVTQQTFLCEYHLGTIFTYAREHGKAKAWLLKALATSRKLPSSAASYTALNGAARVYTALGADAQTRAAYPEAVRWYNSALAESKATNSRDLNAITTIHNNLADLYLRRQQVDSALFQLARAQRLASRCHASVHAMVLGTSAQVHLALKQPRTALGYALYATKLAHDHRIKVVEVQCTALLEEVYLALGEPLEAYRYAKQTQQLQQELQTAGQAQALAELQTRYEVKQKERDIRLLRQRTEIQQLAALQQRTLRNASFAVSGLLLVAAAIFYNRYRLRQRTVRQLDQQNQEKAWLLKEVHHRVKNNLQIVLSLLDSQRRALHEPTAVRALQESQNRIRSMALIHQQLYQNDDLARIAMPRYCRDLLDALADALRPSCPGVQLHVDVAPVALNVHTVVPLGLILNELVTNAYKSAFPPDWPRKELRVCLAPAATAGTYELAVADTGVGLPDLNLNDVSSLGLRLVLGLVQQLGGELRLDRTAGTAFRIIFREVAPAAAGFSS